MNLTGQTLVEVLVAMTVGVLVLTAITSSVLTSLVNTRVNQEQNLASQFAQEGMEIARASRSAPAGTYCLDEGETRLTGAPEGTCTIPNVGGSYIRTVSVFGNDNNEDCGVDVNRLAVSVLWSDSSCSSSSDFCHEIMLDSCAHVVAVAGTITPTVTPTATPAPVTADAPIVGDFWVSSSQLDTEGNNLMVNNTRYGYIKFDLSSFNANLHVAQAILHLEGGSTTNTLMTADNNLSNEPTPWTEDNVSWITRPLMYSSLQTIANIVNVDVTDYVQSRLGQEISFGITSTSSLTNPWISSDYPLSGGPTLSVTTQGFQF